MIRFKSSASVAAIPYVFLLLLLEVLPQFFALVSALHMLGSTSYFQLHLVSVLDVFSSSSYMQMLFTFSLLDCMTCFISAILVMLYLVFLLAKFFGKFLIFPTVMLPPHFKIEAFLLSGRRAARVFIDLGVICCEVQEAVDR